MVMTTTPQKIGASFFISRELAIQHGLVQATRDEQAQREAEHAAFLAKRDAAQPALHDGIRALDAITDQPARLILDLHQRVPAYDWKCHGCDAEGWESEPPEWPCRTTVAIAEHYGIPLPDLYLLRRPEDGSLDSTETQGVT